MSILHICLPSSANKGFGVASLHDDRFLTRLGVKSATAFAEGADVSRSIYQHQPRLVVFQGFTVGHQTAERLCREFHWVKFITKLHCNTQFLASEGAGFFHLENAAALATKVENYGVAAATEDTTEALRAMGIPAMWMPNVYEPHDRPAETVDIQRNPQEFHVGLFGAFRPFKNATAQMCALAIAAPRIRKHVVLHVNGTRVESGGSDHKHMQWLCGRAGIAVVEHGWMHHDGFRGLCVKMNAGLQVSMTEAFNYVAADLVSSGVTVVGSPAVKWLPPLWRRNPDDLKDIAEAIVMAQTHSNGDQRDALERHNLSAQSQWEALLDSMAVKRC